MFIDAYITDTWIGKTYPSMLAIYSRYTNSNTINMSTKTSYIVASYNYYRAMQYL